MEIPEWIKHLKSLQSALGSCSKMVMPETHRGSRHHRWYKVVQNRMELVSLLKASLQDASDGSSSWRETREGLFNFLWTWKRPKIRWDRLFPWQRVNHFRGVQVITKKDKLKETLHHYQGLSARFASAFALQPDTFVLPREYTAFVRSYSDYASMAGCKNLWILKPASMSRGRGIHLVKDLGDVSYASEAVIQKYVEKPLLLDGYKFDLRIYVLVTSFQPLEAFIYRDGFARFALDKFCVKESSETKSSRANINNLRMHLTNSSVQHARLDLEEALLRATPFQRAPASEIGGSKMTLSELWRQLRSAGHDVEKIQSAIDDCIVRSLLCADDHIAYQPCAFEVFGYDILVDANLRPWLVEVNASPSMGCLNDLDRRLKGALIRDTVALVDPTPFDAVVLRRVVDAALAYAGGSRRQATKMLFGAAIRSLPASALATRFKSMPRPSDRIRSRYLDRLRIMPKTPPAEPHSSSDTVPIPIENARRSTEYQWDASEGEEEDEDATNLDADHPTTTSMDGFFQIDDLDREDDDDIDDEEPADPPRRPPPPVSSTREMRRSYSSGKRAIGDDEESTTSSSRAIRMEVKSNRNSRRFSDTHMTGNRFVPSSFVPPHELIQRGWGQRESYGLPHRYRRKKRPYVDSSNCEVALHGLHEIKIASAKRMTTTTEMDEEYVNIRAGLGELSVLVKRVSACKDVALLGAIVEVCDTLRESAGNVIRDLRSGYEDGGNEGDVDDDDDDDERTVKRKRKREKKKKKKIKSEERKRERKIRKVDNILGTRMSGRVVKVHKKSGLIRVDTEDADLKEIFYRKIRKEHPFVASPRSKDASELLPSPSKEDHVQYSTEDIIQCIAEKSADGDEDKEVKSDGETTSSDEENLVTVSSVRRTKSLASHHRKNETRTLILPTIEGTTGREKKKGMGSRKARRLTPYGLFKKKMFARVRDEMKLESASAEMYSGEKKKIDKSTVTKKLRERWKALGAEERATYITIAAAKNASMRSPLGTKVRAKAKSDLELISDAASNFLQKHVESEPKKSKSRIPPLDTEIFILPENPKRGKSYERFEKYKRARTVKEYFELGGTRADLLFDMKRNYVMEKDVLIGGGGSAGNSRPTQEIAT
eukprot:g17.t1